jgi:SAM-dependent methyltransferase
MSHARRYDEFIHNHPRIYHWRGIIKNRLKVMIASRLVPEWDAVIARHDQVLDEMMRAHCTGKRVLDIGCGPGPQVTLMKRFYQARPCGIDYSLEMVQSAKPVCAAEGIAVVCGDATRLPFSDGSFDTVTFFWVFHHLPAALHGQALAEARRVAREVVIIRDSFNFAGRLSRWFGNLYWRVVDGGYLYRTRAQWAELFGDAAMVEEYGVALNRNCIFVVRANPANPANPVNPARNGKLH